ncbi:MAG: hypothetical protein ACJ790_11965, partial [Myxococcaceae bacterium]
MGREAEVRVGRDRAGGSPRTARAHLVAALRDETAGRHALSPNKRHDTEESFPAAPAYSESPGGELLDLLSAEGREHLDSFTAEDQQLFAELIEDAASDLQAELIRRALAARHTPKELHAFSDQIRGLDDDELYAAVTLEELGPGGGRRSVVQRMRAEADPIYGFTLNGHTLTGDGEASGFDALGLPVRPRPSFDAPAALSAPAESDFENSIARGRRIERHELGESRPQHTTGGRKAIDRRELGESQPENTAARARALADRDLGTSRSNAQAGDDVYSQAVRA